MTKHKSYSCETKLAAARDVVDGVATKPETMEKHGIASLTPLERWCRAYREDSPDALPKGRPRKTGNPVSPAARKGSRRTCASWS